MRNSQLGSGVVVEVNALCIQKIVISIGNPVDR